MIYKIAVRFEDEISPGCLRSSLTLKFKNNCCLFIPHCMEGQSLFKILGTPWDPTILCQFCVGGSVPAESH